MQSETLSKLATSLVAVQAEMPKLVKSANNPFFKSKYVDLATVMESILPILAKNGLALTQFVSNLDGQSALTTTLLHTSGEYISATMPLLLPKNDPQGQGSAITYARRYGAMAALGIVADEDDDGNKAAKSYQESQVMAYPKPPTKAEREKALTPLDKAKGELARRMQYDEGISARELKQVVHAAIGKDTVDDLEEVDLVNAYLDTIKEPVEV
jgi:hypothetical protein